MCAARCANHFKRWQREEEKKIIRLWEVRFEGRQLSRRNDLTRSCSSSSPRKRFSSVATKHTRRARKKTKKVIQHEIATLFLNLFCSSSFSSLTRKFKLKIIHSTSHVRMLNTWNVLPSAPYIPSTKHYNSSVYRVYGTGGNFCCFAFNCDGK